VLHGCGHDLFDFEGRIIQARFGDIRILSCYFPSGTTGDIRQEIKYQFLSHFFEYIENEKSKNKLAKVA
jgi:exodeoxyribonuclease-3